MLFGRNIRKKIMGTLYLKMYQCRVVNTSRLKAPRHLVVQLQNVKKITVRVLYKIHKFTLRSRTLYNMMLSNTNRNIGSLYYIIYYQCNDLYDINFYQFIYFHTRITEFYAEYGYRNLYYLNK